MKTTMKYIPVFIALWLYTGCANNARIFETDITIIIDKTDRMTVYPTAGEIISKLGLKGNPWQGIRITATYVSDKDINDVTVLTLEGENQWSGNIIMRKAKIQHFSKQLQRCLSGMEYNGTCPYSIIYRTIARQINRLAASDATRKILLTYSDLQENDTDLDFYDPKVKDKIAKNPQSIIAQLEATVPLKSLNGLQIWLLYSPTSYRQNNTYLPVAMIYNKLFESKGAIVHIEKTLNL